MAIVKKLKFKKQDFYPITHENLVLDSVGSPIATKIGSIDSLLEQNLVLSINKALAQSNLVLNNLESTLQDWGMSLPADSSFDAYAEYISTISNQISNETSLEQTYTNRLYQVMFDGGYDVDASYNLETLIAILESEGISTEDIQQVYCGSSSTFLLKTDGTLWACGLNDSGQLGLGDTTNRTTFTQVTTNVSDIKEIFISYYHTFLLKTNGTLWACGLNDSGQLGLGDIANRTTFTQVTTNISDVKQIDCGYQHSLLLKNDGTLWVCGSNSYGQLGLGESISNKATFTQVTEYNNISQVSCGYYFSYILKNDGTVYNCGQNNYGQLGVHTGLSKSASFSRATTGVRAIRCSTYHCFLITTDNTIKATGYNNYGQLGTGNTTNQTSFVNITTVSPVKDIICGQHHTFVIKQDDNSVWFTGRTSYGQLGSGSSATIKILTKVDHISDYRNIICGNHDTFIIKNDDTLWTCGYNASGQLGLGDTSNRSTLTLVTLPET